MAHHLKGNAKTQSVSLSQTHGLLDGNRRTFGLPGSEGVNYSGLHEMRRMGNWDEGSLRQMSRKELGHAKGSDTIVTKNLDKAEMQELKSYPKFEMGKIFSIKSTY